MRTRYPPSTCLTASMPIRKPSLRTNAVAVLDALKINKAHMSGSRWVVSAPCIFGLRTPQRALSLTVAGAGYGCEKEYEEYFRGVSLEVADHSKKQGAKKFSKVYALAQAGCSFQNKDPAAGRSFARSPPPRIPIASGQHHARRTGAEAVVLRSRGRA